MSDSSDLNRGRSGPAWVHYALVGVVAALIVFWRLGAAALDDHECHLALAARTMADPDPRPWIVEGVLGTEGNYIPYEIPRHTTLNHWMVPVENARPRLVKTPLPYWIVALLGRCGWGVTEWSARFPAAVGAVLLVLVTLGLGRRMLSRRAALMGAVMLATCVGFQKWGRNARPEMLLALFMTGAMGCFYLGLTARTRRTRLVWMIAFWVAMGLGNLSKQFVPLLLVWGLVGYLLWRNLAADKDDLTALRALRKFLILTGVGLVVHIAVTSVPWLHWWRVVRLGHGLGVYVTMGLALGLLHEPLVSESGREGLC
jgi:4-amino-4-deoxy-L-arabinose transferase-like glycosyltransferase